MVLKKLISGTIDIIEENNVLVIQFNCNCEDALPYCQAMCCKMRPQFNVALDPDEAGRFEHIPVPLEDKLIHILPWKGDHSCIHLEENKCKVHDSKPRLCREEHCSPRGNINDPDIKTRFSGWGLFPTGMKAA